MYSRSITNRLFDTDGDLFPLFAVFIAFVIVVLFVVIPMIYIKVLKFYNKTYGNNEQGAITEDNSARIISKRTDFEKLGFPANQTFTVNRVTFELSNGSRIELAIKEPDIFGTMAEGDTGCLRHQGKNLLISGEKFNKYSRKDFILSGCNFIVLSSSLPNRGATPRR